jgi:predicted transglutaminase-like cysteine proteinase
MRLLTIIVVFFPLLLSASIFELTQIEKEYIKDLPENSIIARRFNHFYQFLHQARSFSIPMKIFKTNLFINKIIPKNDIGTNEWASPKEFLIKGSGDCEDYVIAKYFTLLELGINENQLFLSVVKVKGEKDFHMILLYLDDFNKIYVLDNLSWKVVLLKDRKNLIFQYAFNKNNSFILNNNSLIVENNIKREEVSLINNLFLKSNLYQIKQ